MVLACFRSYYLYEYLYQKVDILKNNKDNIIFYADTSKIIGGENRKTKIEVVFYHTVWDKQTFSLVCIILMGVFAFVVYLLWHRIQNSSKKLKLYFKNRFIFIVIPFVKIKNFINSKGSSDNTNHEFEKTKETKNSDNFNNNQNLNTMYGKDKEILGIEQTLDTLLEKKTAFQKELSIASDAGIKFDLRKKIEDLDSEIAELREKLNQLRELINQEVNNKVEKLPTTPHKTNSENMQTKIYFSYAWGDDKEQGESREKIVNDLYDSLTTDGYKLVRDKVDLGYKGYISDFMQEIGKGDIIIVAVSQKYAKSPFCMFELYEIARNCGFDKYKFRDKVVPIMVEFVDFAKPKILDEHLEYWQNEYTEWENLVTKRARQLSKEHLIGMIK